MRTPEAGEKERRRGEERARGAVRNGEWLHWGGRGGGGEGGRSSKSGPEAAAGGGCMVSVL